MENNYVDSAWRQFQYYKLLGDKSIARLTDAQLNWRYNNESNSVATIVRHLSGNMCSRFTNFLTEDGEKSWRNRDEEFSDEWMAKNELVERWEKGWSCLFQSLQSLTGNDVGKIVYIRNEGHTVMEAINRQLSHYPYHVGQIVFVAKMIAEKWESLSIPKNESGQYNEMKFSKEKSRRHFTDGMLTDSGSAS
jgi:Protein of unknown function (DUF1572)